MSEERKYNIYNEAEDPSKVISDVLAPQLGTDPFDLSTGVDMRRLSHITPDMASALVYCSVRGSKNRAFRKVFNAYLNILVSVDGRGRKQIIQMQLASKGNSSLNIKEDINKPGWISRNITNRDWEKEQRERMNIE